MKNMSRRRFWAGKACFWQTVVSPAPILERNSIPWEPSMNKAHGSVGLKLALKNHFHQLRNFCPTTTKQNPPAHENTSQPSADGW